MDGVELFALGGPTGAGKSSLIDAMMFALYGKVPRLRKPSVAPLISAGMGTAKVALEFEVDGHRYNAVRVAERTRSGASVREARLERGGSPLADGSGNVTEAVTELLRLGFEDFTRTVVLPQGEFSRFLTSAPAERQGLLRKLLGLEIYSQMRAIASTRSEVAAERRKSALTSREQLSVATDEEMTTAATRLAALADAEQTITAQEDRLEELTVTVSERQAIVEKIEESLTRLDAVAAPDDLETFGEMERRARENFAAVTEVVETQRALVLGLEEEAAGHPSVEQLERTGAARRELGRIDTQIAELGLVQAEERVASARAAAEEAKGSVEETRSKLATRSATHAAHAIAATLQVGDPCPVCQVEVVELPAEGPSPELDAVQAELAAAETALEKARAHLSSVTADRAAKEATRTQLESRRSDLSDELADSPSTEQVDTLLARLIELDTRIQRERDKLGDLDTQQTAAQRQVEDAAESVRSLGNHLDAARLSVAALDPPLPGDGDLLVRWKEMLVWCEERRGGLTGELTHAAKLRSDAIGEAEAVASSLRNHLARLGVPETIPFRLGLVTELERARQVVAGHEKTAEEASRLDEIIETSTREAEVAKALAKHLRADGLERWLAAGALDDLVDGSNSRLDLLSSGAHSLQADQNGGFSIIDHRNADEVRAVATLSGGETFLVSLALALSLAEILAARGGTSLDTIILDEGFGTLDGESLEVVIAVLEDLAGSGLMVGVITHVKDLAARTPTRFEVRKLPGGSVVETVET